LYRHGTVGLLLVSSIAVFNGLKAAPDSESDLPDPINVYGATKWHAERATAAVPQHLIVRTGWLFGGGPSDKKFVGQILNLAATRTTLEVVADRFGSPTSAEDLAIGVRRLLAEGAQGLVHLVNAGEAVSRYELACQALAFAHLQVQVQPVSSSFFPGLAPRPRMEAARSERVGSWLRPWPEALQDYVSRRPALK